MGSWGVGPFDNDIAADWCGDLDDAEPAKRPGLVRDACTAVLDSDDDCLDGNVAVEAIAAAAVVVSQQPDAAPLTSVYAPDFLVEGGRLELPADVPALAVRALDRIAGGDSEWLELWEVAGEGDAARAVIQELRDALSPAAG